MPQIDNPGSRPGQAPGSGPELAPGSTRGQVLPTNGHKAPEAAVLPAQPNAIFNAGKVVATLESLMARVTAQEVSAENVFAACRCASEISNLLRLHLEAEKLIREDNKIKRAEQRLMGRS